MSSEDDNEKKTTYDRYSTYSFRYRSLMKPLLLIFFIMLSFSVQSNETELNVVTENWPPFIIEGEEITGKVTQNIREILSYTDISYTLGIYPWARSFHLATTKPNTLIYSIFRTTQRESKFHWFCPIYKSTPIYAFKLASNDINIDSFETLRNGVVGIMRGDNSHSYFLQEGFQEGVNIDVSANENTNIRKLVKGRVDVVVQSKEALLYRLGLLGIKDLDIVSGIAIAQAENAEHCMALSLGTKAETVKRIGEGFKQWQNINKE